MPVYHSLKTIFVRVPKTASTSISEKLHAIDAHARYFSSHSNQSRAKLVGERFKHEGITEIKKNITLSCFDQYYKIGFVRNPWDWLVSCYFYYKNTDLSTQGALSSGKIIYDEGFEQFYKIRDIKNCSFDEFITLVESATRDIKDGANLNQLHHPYQPQYKYLVDENENLIVDFVGKYEKLEEEWCFLCDKLNFHAHKVKNINLAHFNSGNRQNYQKYYCDATAERVYQIYAKDIVLFNYKF